LRLIADALVGRERRRHEQSPASARSRDRDRGEPGVPRRARGRLLSRSRRRRVAAA